MVTNPNKIMMDKKQRKNLEYFNCLFCRITNYTRFICEFKSRNAMAKASFNRKTNLRPSKLDLNWRKKTLNCYTWSTAVCGAGSWTPRKVYQKYLESFEMWSWRRLEKISWTDSVRNAKVLQWVKKERNMLQIVKIRRLSGLVTYC
jgi:hypothetical protein